ncbi:MAG TPA: PQQ-binding-like beta-propeller repeat protein [Vicinamibacterales bacterium]|nr:PQQ-binding-like beta-propeller repeat protein [Vicinamibacterales bacterium]
MARLRLAWAWAMGPGVQEPEPLVYKGVMYLLHADGVLQALDARSGRFLWEYRRDVPADLRGSDPVRNIALYRERLFLGAQDGHLVALDAATGKVAWDVAAGDYRNRVNYSTGPIAADGRIFAGQTCGVGATAACALSAFDAATGRRLWTRESVAGPNDPPAHQATWRSVPYERRRKASFWMAGSYDPELKTLYWTTASTYPYPEIHRGTGDGELLYTNSILALDAATGSIRWFFQMQPRDNFDMDHQDNPILADVVVDGRRRRAVFVIGKPGILWAFDRETGEHLWNRQLVTDQNVYASIDPKTGALVMNEAIIPKQVGVTQLVCPGMRGGKLFQTKSYDPARRVLYTPVSNACTTFEVVPLEVNASGVRNDRITHMTGSRGNVGRLAAVEAASGRLLWNYDQRVALGSPLATAGGLVFIGDFDRYFRALDADTGKVAWQIPLSGPVTGYPISYAVEGQQYIAVGVGGGTPGQRNLAQLYPEVRSPIGSNVLMVFALGDGASAAPTAAGVAQRAAAPPETGKAAAGGEARRSQGTPSRTTPPARGWYTRAQAQRGRIAYDARCASCHGKDFSPDDYATGLAGAAFDWRWRDRTVFDLFEITRTTMPPGEVGTLTPRTTADIVAYLLQANGYPAGRVELPADPAAMGRMRLGK